MFFCRYHAWSAIVLFAVSSVVVQGCTDNEAYIQLKEEPAADFSMEQFNGGTFQLSSHKDKPVLINFFASWCVSCGAEIPVLEKVYAEYGKKGVVFVGVAIDDTEPKAREFVEKFNLTYPTGLDKTGVIKETYNLYGMPTTLFVDRDGIIKYLHLGGVSEDLLRHELDKLL